MNVGAWVAAYRSRRAGRPRRRPLSPAAERILRTAFMVLVAGILVAAALLSFGALRERARAAGIIHGDLGLPLLELTLSAHTLAGIWALTVKSVTAVGIIGIRLDPEDRRAWAALLGGLGMDLAFQTYGYDNWIARLQAAVPPLALALAIWIFEVPGRSGTSQVAIGEVGEAGDAGQPLPSPGRPVPGPTSPSPAPQPTPAHRNGDRPVPVGAEVARTLSHPEPSGPRRPATIRSQDPPPALRRGGRGPEADLTSLPAAQLLPGRGDLQALARVKDDPVAVERIIRRRGLDPARAQEVIRRWTDQAEPREPAGAVA